MIKKYRKVYKNETNQWFKEHTNEINQIKKDHNRLQFHIMPDIGWLNDPNGLFEKDGITHIYYQYCPFDTQGTLKLWGHVTTKDFLHYQKQPIALYPDQDMDQHGVYSGSAFIKNDVVHYFYTGNVKYFDKDDYDYILSGRGSNQIHLTSSDGLHFSDKKCLLTTLNYPKNMSNHVRDPKIFEKDNHYYMVLGARDIESKGCILMYESNDLEHWNYYTTFSTKQTFGYMWECPDMFELDGKLVLLSCPQGVNQQGFDYANIHQTTSMFLDADFKEKSFNILSIHQLDRGFDFYAQQTYLDEKGRRIMIGWMGIPDADYTNPTTDNGWQHALTLARELKIKNGKLIQLPLVEYEQLRISNYSLSSDYFNKESFSFNVYEMKVHLIQVNSLTLILRKDVQLFYNNHILTLDISLAGSGRTTRSIELNNLNDLHIFSDTTSLEIFVNNGEEVFTTRIYCKSNGILSCNGEFKECLIDLYELKGFIYEETL